MEKKLKRLLIGFFIAMLLFTIVSRAAASVMVARVTTDTVKGGSLTFELSGSGTIKENAKKYIDLISGYKIAKVVKKTGDTVEKGDVLFHYDTKQLEKKKETLDDELKKLQFQYEKAGLGTETSGSNTDLEGARIQKENAEADLKEAKEALIDIKNRVQKKKQEDYDTAMTALEDLKTSKEEATKTAQRAATDAENDLAKLEKPNHKLDELLDDFKSAVINKKEDEIAVRSKNLFDFYYNGKYKEHQLEIGAAEKSLQRAKEDLEDIKKKWDSAINYWDQFSGEESVKKAYEQQAASRNTEIKSGNRAVSDAEDNLNKLKETDVKLDNAIQNYRTDIQNNNTIMIPVSYQTLYQLLYDNLKLSEEDINAAKAKIARAKEDVTEAAKKWDGKLSQAQKKTDELYRDLQAMKDGSYDYKEDIKEGKKAVESAKRTLETAKLQFIKSKEDSRIKEDNEQNTKKSTEIELASLQLDINHKQSEINEVTALIERKGTVLSPVNGVISKSDLDYGITLAGSEKLIISTGGYELTMTADKEEMKYFSVGDDIEIKKYNSNETIPSQVETIGIPDGEGKVNFTALLPEGEYREGNSLDYKLKKDSDEFRDCIPVQAIRMDSNNRTYVLMVKEKDSVLGKEQSAFRLDVTVIDKDRKTAAIEGSLSDEDLIIIDSNKEIAEGDRVRLNEAE